MALDLAYIAKSTFYNKAFFVTLIIIVLLRMFIIISGFLGYLFYQLAYIPALSTSNVVAEDNEEEHEADNEEHEDGRRSKRF